MEGNKEEAVKCRRIAEKYLSEGNKIKAEKLFRKAQRLYPSNEVEELLKNLSKNDVNDEKARANDTSDGVRHRTRADTSENTSNGVNHDYTQEQVDAVRRIRKCKDYYEILGVPRDVSEVDLKKAYRKLALKLHPDKCKAPGSAEAFKAVGNAFAVLTDPEKKSRYDRYGDENPQSNISHGHYDYSRGFEADLTPEEIFNMFFGGPMPGGRVYVSRRGPRGHAHRHHHTDDDEEQRFFHSFVQFLPIIILIALSVLSSLMLQDPPYSLSRSSSFYIERKTERRQVPYYVQDDFVETYRDSIKKIERRVEQEYIGRLQNQCFRERQYLTDFKFHEPLRRVTWLAVARATRLASALRDKLHEILPRATSALKSLKIFVADTIVVKRIFRLAALM